MYLYFWVQDIHLSEFTEKHPKNADLFLVKMWGDGSRIFVFDPSILMDQN